MSIRRHTFYNLLGSVLPLALSLVTIPVYLGLIGEDRYGVLAIAWLLLGYFGLFDLGLGRAIAQRIASLGEGEIRERAEVFWTALGLNLGLGVIGGLVLWPVAIYFFSHVFEVDEAVRPEVVAAVPWLLLGVPIATLASVLTGALLGRERFLEINLISLVGTVFFQLLPLGLAALWGADLALLLPAALFARFVTVVILFGRCRRHVFSGHAFVFVRSRAKSLLGFGGWVTVSSVIGPLMVMLDRILIAAISGAKAVTYYTVPFQLGERSTILSSALASAVFPRFASASKDESERLAEEGLRALAVVMTPLIAIGIVLLEPFLSMWIDSAFAERAAPIGQIVLMGFWVNGLARIPYSQLQAGGRPDLVAKTHLAELIPYFVLLYLGMTVLGLAGAALAFSMRVMADFLALSWLAGMLPMVIRSLLLPVMLLGVVLLISMQADVGSHAWYAFVVPVFMVILMWAWLQAPASIRSIIHTRLPSWCRNVIR